MEFENIFDYTSNYQPTYDKVVSLLRKRSHINIEIIELLLQANMICNLVPKYSRLVSLIQSKYKKKITNLANTILKIIRYEEIFKKANSKVLLISQQTLKSRYITPEYIAQNATSYYPDCC